MEGFRFPLAALAGLALALSCGAQPAHAANPSCGQVVYKSPQSGTVYEVLFAKNGAVQAYRLKVSSNNPEADHDVQRMLAKEYGPEGEGAPPLRIVSYKPGPSGGMMIPDKAVDSCGRVTVFH